MLSKVVAARDGAGVRAAVFPFVNLNASGAASAHAPAGASGAAAVPGESAALRESIRQLEARRGTDVREAFEAGREQGEQQTRAEWQPVLEKFNASVNEIMAMRPELRRRAERDVVQLALLIARRVLHRELGMDENALSAIARLAFERLTRSEAYTVTVHPRFAPAVQAALPGSQAARVSILSDPGCAAGTLVIHSSEGVIDASVETQLDEISRGLTDRLAKS